MQKRVIEEVVQLPPAHAYRQNTLELLSNLKVTFYLKKIQAAERVGEQRGEKQKQQEIALNLLRQNIPLETIAAATGLTIEQLQQLSTNL